MRASELRSWIGRAAWFLALAVAATPWCAADELCEGCHEVTVAEASVHAGFACTDCHMDYDEDTHPEGMTVGAELCAGCHDTSEIDESVHADVDCQGCHGSGHEVLPKDDLDSMISPVRQVVTCDGCHGPERHAIVDGYLTSVHGHALLDMGLVSAPSCSSCHTGHSILPPSDPRSSISFEHVPETCGTCHQILFEEWREGSAHGQTWAEGSRSAPVCITCHGSHMGHEVHRPSDRAMRLQMPENCGDCHTGPYGTYRDSFHGQVTELGFLSGATCSDCHTPHQNLPADDPRSSVHPDNLAATCGTCHEDVNEAFLSFDPHSDPSNPERSKAVYWVWLFMTTLLISVFAFFGVHDLLWLQRLAVGFRRGEWKRERHDEGPWVKRFPKYHVRTHAVVIITFLILAATGLPLKFHYTAWAQALTSIPGTVAVLRLLHRLAAVLTFGYALVHLGFILHRALVLKAPGLFWGWRSLVPNVKDLRDMWNNLRFFLYQEPQLRLDRWSYWEKFDYFAVFWGVPIIGGSGLVLWLPDLFTRFLPGWVLNAAYVIHSDEALLATGFIFVFHFFHTHLRPEIFPFDPVIFTGSMPLSRFKEERPLEYERLVEAGELENNLVEAPSAFEMRTIFARGFVALALGLLLGIAIFWSLLRY